MNETRRAVLAELEEAPASGPELAEAIGVSRTAVWKHVDALRAGGFEIDVDDGGYRLEGVPEYGAEAIEYRLGGAFELEYHDATASTNERARELAREGASNVVVVAEKQTGGRGRRDRDWASPPGGLWMSVLFRPDGSPSEMGRYTLAAAVAVADAARTRGVEAGLKWPNDVLATTGDGEEAKLAGVLTEMEGERGAVSWLVLGIGVNANVDAAGLPEGATSLRALSGDVDRARFAAAVLERIGELQARPAATVRAWRERAWTLGRRVRVTLGDETVVGEAIDVTETGSLRVGTDEGEVQVHAGDCEHLRRE